MRAAIAVAVTNVLVVSAQQVYIAANSTSPRPYCSSQAASEQHNKSIPTYTFTKFSYTLTETVRTATPLPSATTTATYGPSYDEVSCLFPGLSTTSWGNWDPTATATETDSADPYGHSAYTALWKSAGLNVTSGIYTTTVSPTPVATSELVLPPPLYFGPKDCYYFPDDFILGVSGAAAQIEGAVASEGRGPAMPDFLEQLSELEDPVEGWWSDDFQATENYYLYKQDIERLAAIGVKYYSFSISWSRIMPFALPGTPVNSQALQHYSDLVDFVIQKGMTPVATLIHFDTPAVFLGGNYTGLLERSYLGKLNAAYQADGFLDAMVNYGKIVLAHFSNRVPIWITFNEPQWSSADGVAVNNVLKSHAQLYRFYHDELNGTGKVSMKMGAAPGVPLNPLNESDVAAAQRYNDIWIGSFLNPIALGVDYPDAFKSTIQNYVPLNTSDLTYLNNTLDFLGLDVYSAPAYYAVVNDTSACGADNSSANALYPACIGSTAVTRENWAIGPISDPTYGIYNTAPYVRTQLSYMWNTYRLPIVVTEFGLTMSPSTATDLPDLREDRERSEFILSYLTEMLKCIWEDGIDVRGAFMWSFVDNWEWGTYNHQFGLQQVNRSSMTRSYRRSFFDVIDFVESHRGSH